jgi:hypothetical protein
MDKTIGPASRTLRFLLFTAILASTILWAARAWVPRPWIVVGFTGRDMLALFLHREFWFNGHWRYPSWHYFYASYQYLAGSWQASLTTGAALFVGGVAALWIDRLVVRWNRP